MKRVLVEDKKINFYDDQIKSMDKQEMKERHLTRSMDKKREKEESNADDKKLNLDLMGTDQQTQPSATGFSKDDRKAFQAKS